MCPSRVNSQCKSTRYARWFIENIAMTLLLVLGAVFGVLHVALGVEMIADGFKSCSSP